MEGLVRTIANRIGLELPAGITPDEVSEDVLSALVDDLLAHEGSSLVVAGDSQPASVHALVHALNYVLGNIGQTVHFHPPATTETDQLGSLKTLVDDINAGSVQTLLILGGNPVYSAPANLDMASAIASVPFSAHLSTYVDETSSRTSWHLPQTHDLEVWGDAKAFDGTVSIGQPLIHLLLKVKHPWKCWRWRLVKAAKQPTISCKTTGKLALTVALTAFGAKRCIRVLCPVVRLHQFQ